MKKEALSQSASAIASLILAGIAAWMDAGKKLVELLDAGNDIEAIHEQMPPGISLDTLIAFERIGRREVVPQLLISDYPAAQCLRKMPFEQQERLLASGVDILTISEGGVETLHVAVADLTRHQCRQVFDECFVRTAAQQRAWMESEKAIVATQMAAKSAMVEAYSIRGRKVLFNRSCELTRAQIAMLLAQMEAA